MVFGTIGIYLVTSIKRNYYYLMKHPYQGEKIYQLSQWKKAAIDGLPDLFERKERELQKVEKEHQQEVDKLYKKIGDLTIQVDWLKKKSEEVMLKRRTKGND